MFGAIKQVLYVRKFYSLFDYFVDKEKWGNHIKKFQISKSYSSVARHVETLGRETDVRRTWHVNSRLELF